MKVNSMQPGGILNDSIFEERQPTNSWMMSEKLHFDRVGLELTMDITGTCNGI